MSALQFELPDSRVLDLFAGSGALGLEALSRGAAHVTFVEQSTRAIEPLRANALKLGAHAFEVVRADALDYAERLTAGAFDVALADPPYGDGEASRLVQHFARVPFAHAVEQFEAGNARLDVLFHLHEDEWQGRRRLQARLVDLRPAEGLAERGERAAIPA